MLSEEEIEKAKGWLSALNVNSEFEASSKEILLSHIEELEFQNNALQTEHKYNINRIKQLEEYLKRISKQLDNVAIDQIPIGIKELQQENKTLKHINKSYKGIIRRLNKMIDEMAYQLAGLAIWNNEKEETLILGDKEEVKQYFEKKVEEGNV